MQSYFLENGTRQNIKITLFSSAIDKNSGQFYIEYDRFKWECHFQKSSSGGVHPSWHYGQNIRLPNTTATVYENLIDFYAKGLHPRDNGCANETVNKYLRIEILNKDLCVFSFVGEMSDYMTFKNVFDLKTIKQQHPNLLLTDVLEIAVTIGTRDSFVCSSDLGLSTAKDEMETDSIKSMLDKSVLTDIVIRTREKDFPCHKVVLASCSDVFRAMFETKMIECSEKEVDLRDQFDAATIHDLLHYMYTKNTPPNIRNTCKELFIAADYFQVSILKTMCVQMLRSVISINNAACIVQLAETYNVEVLKTCAVNFITEHFPDVVTTPEWNSIPQQMTKNLLTTFLSILSQKKCATTNLNDNK